jgi:hypothetical protein
MNVVCDVQHKSDKARAFRGMQGTDGGVDLMIVDIPKGLPVPMVSSPPTSIPGWNSVVKNFLPMVFDFQRLCKGLPLLHLKGMDRNKPLTNHQCQGCLQDSEWFQPCCMLHSCKHKRLRFPCCSSLTM